jgi:thiamine-monophosphate kinase
MASTEDSLIARFFKPLATHPGALGLVDDAAFLTADGGDLVITTDAIVEGVHFLPDDPPETIARKALRVNLSDLAAKGATPAGFVLTLALRSFDEAFLAPFAGAIGEDAIQFACPLLGGDTVSTPGPLMISVTAFGRVPAGRMVRRDNATIGDAVVVTGTIGDAAVGLAILQGRVTAPDDESRDALVARYRVPEPRNHLAMLVRDHATAAMDVSDGLAGDLAKLCAASGVSATIEVAKVPMSQSVTNLLRQNSISIETLLTGGDDYEILCAVPQDRVAAFLDRCQAAATPASVIGFVRAGSAIPAFIDAEGRPLVLKRLSYSHF